MKKLIALLLALSLVFAFAACAKKEPAPQEDGTTVEAAAADDETAEADAETPTEEETTEAKVYELVTYGKISATVAPEGWKIADESADWRIVYVNADNKTVQLTVDEDEAAALAKRVTERMDANDEKYTSDDITVGGVDFVNVVPELGMPAMYGTVDGQTLVVTYDKDVDLQSEAVADIIASVQLTAE